MTEHDRLIGQEALRVVEGIAGPVQEFAADAAGVTVQNAGGEGGKGGSLVLRRHPGSLPQRLLGAGLPRQGTCRTLSLCVRWAVGEPTDRSTPRVRDLVGHYD